MQAWLKENPFPLNAASAPGPAPQFGGQSFGGGTFGGASGGQLPGQPPPKPQAPILGVPAAPFPSGPGRGTGNGPAMMMAPQRQMQSLPAQVRPESGIARNYQGGPGGMPLGLLAILQGRGLA